MDRIHQGTLLLLRNHQLERDKRGRDAQDQWLLTPRYWLKENLLVLAGGRSGFNLAAGGLPQLVHILSALQNKAAYLDCILA